jgi:hypothetical protein
MAGKQRRPAGPAGAPTPPRTSRKLAPRRPPPPYKPKTTKRQNYKENSDLSRRQGKKTVFRSVASVFPFLAFFYVISCACLGHFYLRYPNKIRPQYLNSLTYFLDRDSEAIDRQRHTSWAENPGTAKRGGVRRRAGGGGDGRADESMHAGRGAEEEAGRRKQAVAAHAYAPISSLTSDKYPQLVIRVCAAS